MKSDRTLDVPLLAAAAVLACACATSSMTFPPVTLPKGENQLMFSAGFGPSRWSHALGGHATGAYRRSAGSIEVAVDGEVEYGVLGVARDVSTESLGGEVRLQALRAPVSIVPLAGVRAILIGSHTLEWAPEVGVGIGAESEAFSGGVTLRATWRNAVLRPLDGVLQMTAQAGVWWRPLFGRSIPSSAGSLVDALKSPAVGAKRRWSFFAGVEGGVETDHWRVAIWPELAIGYGF